jgi:hypothetical protein
MGRVSSHWGDSWESRVTRQPPSLLATSNALLGCVPFWTRKSRWPKKRGTSRPFPADDATSRNSRPAIGTCGSSASGSHKTHRSRGLQPTSSKKRCSEWIAPLRPDGFRSKLLLQVHDELVFEVPEDELDAFRGFVVQEMEGAMALNVPLRVDVGVGASWFECK